MLPEFDFYEKHLIKKFDKLNGLLRRKNIGNDIDNTEIATSANGLLIVNRLYGTF